MRLLFLKAYYVPEKASSQYLTTNLVEDLASAGFLVDIIVPTPTRGVSSEIRKEYKRKKYEEQFNGSVKIHRFAMIHEGRNLIIRAVRYFLCSVVHLYKSLLFKDIDLIFITSTPPIQGLLAGILKKIKKVPVLYNLQDIFPDSLVNSKLTSYNSLLYKIGRRIENYTYKTADKIVVISNDFKRNLISKGCNESKIAVIYNWVDENSIIPINRETNELFDKYNLDRNSFYIVYAGNIGHAQNIDVIIKAAGELVRYLDIQFVFFVDGPQIEHYKSIVLEKKLKNVLFFPLQPYSLVSHVYSLGDASIVSCKEGFGKCAMPSKVWSIMSTATAVIASFDEGTDLQKIIEDSNSGIFTKAGDVESLKHAVLKLYNDRDLCKELGVNGRNFVLANLTREVGTQKYIDVINKVVRYKNVHK